MTDIVRAKKGMNRVKPRICDRGETLAPFQTEIYRNR